MTRKLETLFNLDSSDEIEQCTDTIEPEELSNELISAETLDTIEKIENALPQVRGLEASDSEMDQLADLAKEAFNNLMDLGMQIDTRFSAEIFNSASSMLGHAITAKTAKINNKLKMIDLQLKKAEIDRKISVNASKQQAADTPNAQPGTGKVIDRNELLKALIAEAANKKQQNDK